MALLAPLEHPEIPVYQDLPAPIRHQLRMGLVLVTLMATTESMVELVHQEETPAPVDQEDRVETRAARTIPLQTTTTTIMSTTPEVESAARVVKEDEADARVQVDVEVTVGTV